MNIYNFKEKQTYKRHPTILTAYNPARKLYIKTVQL